VAAPTYRAAGAFASGTGTTLGAAVPASTAANDILFILAWTSTSNVITESDGLWTRISGAENANGSYALFWRRAGASEATANLACTGTVGTGSIFCARMWGFIGAETTGDPYEALVVNYQATTAATAIAGTDITTLGTDRLAITLCLVDDNEAWTTAPPPAGWSAGTNSTSATGSDATNASCQKTMASAGAVGAHNVGVMPNAEFYVTATLALFSPGGGGGAAASLLPPSIRQTSNLYSR
jgi:hypothetical protein